MDYGHIIADNKARLVALDNQLAALTKMRDLLAAFIRSAEELARLSEAKPSTPLSHTAPSASEHFEKPKRRSPQNNIMGPTRDTVRQILLEQGRPMYAGALLPFVKAAGVPVGGKNENSTLSARLYNTKAFQNVDGQGWWPIDVPLPGEPTMFEEAEEPAPDQDDSSASNQSEEGGDHHAPALDDDDLI